MDTAEKEFKGMRIVLVDDMPQNLDVLIGTLKELGCNLFVAKSGEQALELLTREVPDLILMDIKMPGMSGLEVCKKIKADPELQQVPVIFITAVSGVEDTLEAFRIGGADYVTKPFNREEVVARVSNLLRLQKALAEKEALLEKFAGTANLYKTIVEKASELIFELNPERQFIFANSSFKFLGYDPVELVGRSVNMLFPKPPSEDEMERLATKGVGPLTTVGLELTVKVNEDSTISGELKEMRFSFDTYGLWSVPDELVFKDDVKKKFLGTLCIGRQI
ncbi:MAG: response regulator [Candidatus Nitrohelix vancouverensis]|uniref:Response regulator n=1 Tax=Candidatus Nitrohelix vancouverensis TaxID=2705534 RepID=A0A7T0C1Y2_9BACT|nr:MAG: response regulator [Candidatus Nitrohelix vancouverensis]